MSDLLSRSSAPMSWWERNRVRLFVAMIWVTGASLLVSVFAFAMPHRDDVRIATTFQADNIVATSSLTSSAATTLTGSVSVNSTSGTDGQLLTIDPTTHQPQWDAPAAAGIITGNLSNTRIPVATGSNTLVDSIFQQAGGIGYVNGKFDVYGAHGDSIIFAPDTSSYFNPSGWGTTSGFSMGTATPGPAPFYFLLPDTLTYTTSPPQGLEEFIVQDEAKYDTSAGDITSYLMEIEANGTKVAGAHQWFNGAVHIIANHGDHDNALWVESGLLSAGPINSTTGGGGQFTVNASTGAVFANGNVTSNGFMQAGGVVYAGGGVVYLENSGGAEGLSCRYSVNGPATCHISAVGFAEGATQPRSTAIDNGMLGNIVTFDGATGHMISAGTAPTLSSCGTGATIVGDDKAFTVTTGTGATACTITFAQAFTSRPTCTIQGADGVGRARTISTSGITITTATASTAYDGICIGH